MTLFKVAQKSLLNRKTTTLLTVFSIALSTCLLLGIERIRSGAKQSFESTISGVDLIVGARSGPVNLLLYSVFRIGNATNNISYQSYDEINNREDVQWTIPISLGDSHKGYRVVGTNENYFLHYKYAGSKKLTFKEGQPFQKLFAAVIGSDVAEKLNYKVSDKIVLSHGAGDVSFQDHADKPFTVVGILEKTGTPVDQSIHVSLQAITALHIDWQNGAPPLKGNESSAEEVLKMNLNPSDITAFFVRLKSRMSVFNVQRDINEYKDEALMAILPGVTLRELWQTIGAAEKALIVVSVLVFIVSLIGMMIALLSTLNERRREMAILRSIGAQKKFIFSVLIIETSLLTVGGLLMGFIMLYLGLFLFRPVLESQVGLTVGLFNPTPNDLIYIVAMILGAFLASLLPAWRAYKNSLSDGLIVKN